MDKVYVVLIGDYERNIHRVFKTLESATKCYTKLKEEWINKYSDLKHYDSIEEVKEASKEEFHINNYYLE